MHENYLLSDGGEDTLIHLCQKAEMTLLYFYPKDMTPGCTKQAQWLRDHYQDFLDKGIQIIGVSRDDVKRHQRFIEKYSLPFILISDIDSILCKTFDVLKEKSMFGVSYVGIVRSTFLLDKEGHTLQQWRNIKLNDHFEVLASLLSDQ